MSVRASHIKPAIFISDAPNYALRFLSGLFGPRGLGPKTHGLFFVNHVFYVPTIFLFYRLKQSSTQASRQA